jgi:hypothetical protein
MAYRMKCLDGFIWRSLSGLLLPVAAPGLPDRARSFALAFHARRHRAPIHSLEPANPPPESIGIHRQSSSSLNVWHSESSFLLIRFESVHVRRHSAVNMGFGRREWRAIFDRQRHAPVALLPIFFRRRGGAPFAPISGAPAPTASRRKPFQGSGDFPRRSKMVLKVSPSGRKLFLRSSDQSRGTATGARFRARNGLRLWEIRPYRTDSHWCRVPRAALRGCPEWRCYIRSRPCPRT